jgi:ribosomal protein S12 methylthiotransferase
MRTKSLKKNKINVITLGCSKNVYDSEVLMGQLKANGKEVVHEQEGNIIVINTCGFIDNAKEESVNTILEYADKKEQGLVDKVFVTGCLSERYRPDLEKEIPNIDQYFGTTELPLLLKALGADYKHELIGERLTTTPKNYAYLKISEGCDRPCSFCAIPLMRGKHVSTPIEKLVIEAEKLAKNGVKELNINRPRSNLLRFRFIQKKKFSRVIRSFSKGGWHRVDSFALCIPNWISNGGIGINEKRA